MDNQATLNIIIDALAEARAQLSSEDIFKSFQEIQSAQIRQKRINDGIYLFRPEYAAVDQSTAENYTCRLLAALSGAMPEKGAGLSRLKELLRGDEAKNFIEMILHNDLEKTAAFSHDKDIPVDIISFIGIYLARPFREEAARRLTDGLDMTPWSMGFCPVCGHFPSFCCLSGKKGKRILWCYACATQWGFERLRCPFCLNEDHDKLGYFVVNDDETMRIDTCKNCRRYLKTRRTESSQLQKDIERYYLLSAPADFIAIDEGYIQESVLGVRYASADGGETMAYRSKAFRGDLPAESR